jgi:PEP-CTERM motif
MKRSLIVAMVGVSIVSGIVCSRLDALTTVTWDGTTSNQWHEGNWTKDGTPGQTADAAIGQDGHVGGRGGVNMIIGGGAMVEHNQNRSCPSSDPCDPNGQGDFKPRMDLAPGGSLTIKEGATLSMDSHTDADGRWTRVGLDITLDNGTLRRTYSAPSGSGGKIIFGYHDELLPNQKININVLNGGRIENDGKMIFGDLDYFASQGGSNNGHSDRIEVAMTINGGTLDLTGGGYPDYPFGLISGELIFGYEWLEGTSRSKEEKYSINFTGPGSITVDPHFDVNAGQYLGGIYVPVQDSSGTYSAGGGAPDLFTPIGYEDLWDLGILQANGESGMTGATFSTYFTTTGDKFHEDYTLTSLLAPPGLPGDYNNDGKVDAADYVLWRTGGALQNEVATIGSNTPEDYTEWRARFGNSAGSGAGLGSSAVPEPATTALLAAIGFIAVMLRRRNVVGLE